MQNEKKTRKTSDLLKIRQLIRLGKKHSLKRLKFDNVEIEFSDKAMNSYSPKSVKYEKEDSKYLDVPTLDMPPDDVMLYAATEQFDHILAERKAAQKR